MDVNILLQRIVNKLDLGTLTEEPSRVTGGLTHRMFKLFTDKGRYIVKLLNPNIMKRVTAMDNYKKADTIEEILKDNNINAIYSLKFNDKKMQEMDGQYFYIYEWYDGRSLKDNEITKYHVREMGKLLANIHNIDIKYENNDLEEKHIDFKYYIDLAKEKKFSYI